jgi:hypothetical protein
MRIDFVTFYFQVTHTCGTSDDWLGCASDPEERFLLIEVITNNVTIIGSTECHSSGFTGFREVRFWGY